MKIKTTGSETYYSRRVHQKRRRKRKTTDSNTCLLEKSLKLRLRTRLQRQQSFGSKFCSSRRQRNGRFGLFSSFICSFNF